jgi:hypothetical protein
MAQTQVILDQGIGALIALWVADATKIVGLNMATPCTAVVGSTFADPADTAAHHTDGGLAIQAIDTVGTDTTNTANDTLTIDHVLTATGTKNLAGIHICNAAGNKSYAECCFNAVLAMENTDTCTIDGSSVINQA